MGASTFGGVWTAAVAPRRDNGHEIDLSAALDVIDFIDSTAASGMSVLGSTGEFIHHDFEDRLRYLQFVLKRARKPVLPGVAHSNIDGAMRLAETAMDHGAAGVLLMPPYYFRYGAAELRRFYLTFADEFDGPIYLYNIPFFASPLPIETATELLATGRFAGIKDSSGRPEYCHALLAARRERDFNLVIGNDCMFTEGRGAGANGVISGVACALPELMCGLEHAVTAGDAAQTAALQALLVECLSWLDRYPVPMALKRALHLRGLRMGPDALPMGDAFAPFDAWFPEYLERVCQQSRLRFSAA